MPGYPEDTVVCCAYDGSVNAHWVARYAIRFAAAAPARRIRLLHVEDRHVSRALLERKLEHVLSDCSRAGVEATVQTLRADGDVAPILLEAVPGGRHCYLLCGTRARPRRARFLAGTVSHALLSRASCNVLALRVVSPGLLGAPRRLLLALAGNPGEGRDVAGFVTPFADTLEALHLLRVVLADDQTARHASPKTMARLRGYGRAALTYVEREMRTVLEPAPALVDPHVRIAESWSRPANVLAAQYRCGLVLAGASARALSGRNVELERLLAHAPCDVGIHRAAASPG